MACPSDIAQGAASDHTRHAMNGDRAVRAMMALMLAVLVVLAAPADARAATTAPTALPSLAPMIKAVTPAVVNVAVKVRVQAADHPLFANPLLRDPLFRNFFDVPGLRRNKETVSAGSGVIIDAERGLAVTNFHVIANAEAIEITLRDRRVLEARLVGADPETDIALLEIPARNLTAIGLGDSDALEVGDFVVAIGNPFGIGQTVTLGIVSALGRGLGIEAYEDFIQTDASINPGNSGGALVDMNGELVGINTAILGRGGNIGIGFAIPTAIVRRIVGQIAEHGAVARGQLGVRTQDLTPDLAEGLGLDADARGVLVVDVMAQSPADVAGLQPGDVVTAANGTPVERSFDLRNAVGMTRVGEPITLDVLRAGQPITLTVTIAERVDEPDAGAEQRLAGAVFAATDPATEPAGVRVVEVEPDSPAYTAGLRAGDIVVAINRTAVGSTDELVAALRASRGRLSLAVLRGSARVFILIG